MNYLDQRKQEMIELREQKWSLQKIGDKFGICRERVRQLIGNTGRFYKYFRIRREEAIAVKKYLRLTTTELAKLYYFPSPHTLNEYVGKLPYVRKYHPGFRRCYVCFCTLPYKKFSSRFAHVCKKCNTKRTYEFQKRTGYRKNYEKQYSKGGKRYAHTLARGAVHEAVKNGILKKDECKLKNKDCHGRIESHHYLGYAEKHRLDVWWVCQKHHQQIDNSGFHKK